MNRWQLLKRNLHQVVIAIDQLINTLLSVIIGLCNGTHEGYADETMSAYLYRHKHYWYANIFRRFVDVIFYFPNGCNFHHCQDSYESEVMRSHLPPDFRK